MSLDLEENVIEVLWYCIEKTGVAEKTMRVVLDMSEGCETFVKCGEEKNQQQYTTIPLKLPVGPVGGSNAT